MQKKKGAQPTYFREPHIMCQRAACGSRAAVWPPLLYTNDPQILVATVNNLVARPSWPPGFVQPCQQDIQYAEQTYKSMAYLILYMIYNVRFMLKEIKISGFSTEHRHTKALFAKFGENPT
jgi:hypothetical protein